MSDDLAQRRAAIIQQGANATIALQAQADGLPGMAARAGIASQEELKDVAKKITVKAGRLTGFLAPKDNEGADALSRELVQFSRASHVANTIGATTDAIVRCTAVFADKRSSDTAKAAAVIRCVATAGQVASLFGPVGLLVSSVVGMISAIMESTTGQSDSMLDQLETLMRKLAGEQTANEINAANRLLQRQIAALSGYTDRTLAWKEVHDEAPLTSGISQFKILAASEWLYREENQANPIWAEVLDCHMQAMLTVVRLLKMCQTKLANPNDPVFLAVQDSIYSDFRAQCIKFDHKISKLGNFWHTGIGDHYVYSSKDLGKSWNSPADWGRFTSIAVSQGEDQKKVTGWGAYNDLGLGSGSFDNDMKILPQQVGCVDINIAPFLIEKENWCRLLITSRGSSGKEFGRLFVRDVKGTTATVADIDASKLDWKKAHIVDDNSNDLQTARAFKTALIKPGDASPMPVPTQCMYLVSKRQDGFNHLGYTRLEGLTADNQTIVTSQSMIVESNRIAVSDRYVFFVLGDVTTVQYCTHYDFVDPTKDNKTHFVEKPHGVLPVKPNDGSHASESVSDLFACADDHLLVVLRSGAIWNVTLRQRRRGSRVLKEDEWDWFRAPGGADRVAMTKNDTVRIFESLKEVVAA